MTIDIYLHILNDFHDITYFYNTNDTGITHFFSTSLCAFGFKILRFQYTVNAVTCTTIFEKPEM